MKNKKHLNEHRQQVAFDLQCCIQNYLVKNGPQYFFPLGKLSNAGCLMKLCRKVLPANKKWQGTKEGGFYYNGETHLSFCAKLGPSFSVNINGEHMRLRTVLVQWKRDGVIHGYALNVCQGIGPLKDKLCLNKAEANALSSMLEAGKDSFADREYPLKISTRKYLPTAQTACIYWDATDISIDSEQTLRSIWERIGPAGRETALAGIFNQLSAKSKSKERPPIIINFVKCGQNLRAIKKLLGAVNFSIQPGVNGTAPNIRKVSTKDDLPFSFGELELYEAGQRGDVFINVLEEHCRPLTQYDSARCPFPAIPLIMTANITLNGNIWNIEIENTIPDLSDVEQDCLRKAASLILQNPQKFFSGVNMEVMVRDSRPDTYRTTLVERWRTALTSHVLRQWFPGEQESIDSLRDADEALRKEREQQHALQLDRAMERLFDPATYQDGRVQPKPEEWDSAVALLQQAYALYYAPSSKKATNTGPFFCFTKESFQRLLVDDGIPAILMDEVMRTLKNDQKITETSKPIHFKVGGSKRMIKVDISAYPGLLTCLQHLQQNLEG